MIAQRYNSSIVATLILAASVLAVMLCCALLIVAFDDPRYSILILLFVTSIVAFSLSERKLELFSWIFVFAICLRVFNANIGKRIPQLEIAYPNLNLFEILLIGAVLYYVGQWLLVRTGFEFPRTIEHKSFLALVFIFLVSQLWLTPSWEFGFDRTVTMVEMYLVYLVSYNLWRSEEESHAVIRILLVTVLFQAALVAMEIALGSASPLQKFVAGSAVSAIGSEGVIAGRRISGSYGDSVVFGWVMSFLFFALLPFGLLSNQKWIARRRIVIGLLCAFAFGLLTMTRTALVGQVLIAPFGIFLLARYYERRLMRWIPKLFLLFSFLLLVAVALPGASEIISRRSSDIEEISGTIELRLASWIVGWRILQDYPLLGMGVGTGSIFAYGAGEVDRFIQSDVEQTRISYAGIHNGHAMMFAEMGIIGYVLYLFFWAAFARRSFQLLKAPSSVVAKQIAVGTIMVVLYALISDFTGVALAFKSAMFYVALWFGLLSRAAANHQAYPSVPTAA